MDSIHKRLSNKLRQRKEDGNYRELTSGTGLVDFFSNDYLGLAASSELFERVEAKCRSFSGNINGATGSRLLSGNNQYIMNLEERLAGLFRTEKALIFNSGYSANMAILSSIPQKNDTILYDEFIHASLKDGARLSFANRMPFRHNDPEDLTMKLEKSSGEKFILAEAVYSMDGDYVPLEEYIKLAERYQAHIILDEAHTTGWWGSGGNGYACAQHLENDIFARVHTFGKAMGVHGACIAGSETLIEYLINFARPFIYTTALPPHSYASIECAFDYLKEHPELQDTLSRKIELFRFVLEESMESKSGHPFYELQPGSTPIQVIKGGGNERTKKKAAAIREQGFDVRPILAPTVKEGEERLRICLHAYNTDQQIKDLANILTPEVA